MDIENPTFEDINKTVCAILQDHCTFILLLGSAGTDRFHKDSDIDLAAYFKAAPDYDLLSKH